MADLKASSQQELAAALAVLRRHVEGACGRNEGKPVRTNAPLYVALEAITTALASQRRERDAAERALGDMVSKATDYGQQDGGFVAAYIIPTGPMHRAIPLLEARGIVVRPGVDGRS